MSNLENELRELYRAVTDTVREEELPGLHEKRSRPRRGRWFGAFVPLAAAAAVVVAIGIGVAVPKLASSPSRTPASATALPGTRGSFAPPPPFMIVLRTPSDPRPLLVVSAATGRTTAEVPVPRADTAWVDAEVTGSDTTFVLAATPNRGGLCNPTYLYTLTLAASGKVVSLRPWTEPVVKAELLSMSASADGRTLAFVADRCSGPDQEIGIIRGRAAKTWRESYPYVYNGGLSVSGDGSKLVYTDSPAGPQHVRVRVLDTGSKPGDAHAASTVVYSYPFPAARAPGVAVSPDFTRMYVSWLTGRDSFHLAGYRIGAGGLQGPLFRLNTSSGLVISMAGGEVMDWNPGVSLYLVNPVTGKAARIRTPWVNAWGITW
jgi:hypothetical protein